MARKSKGDLPTGTTTAATPEPPGELAHQVAAVRRFNRLYTRRIGVLGEGHLETSFGLTEVRVLYELAHRTSATASELAADLGLDAGYLSRILLRFRGQRLLTQEPAADRRQRLLSLSPLGRRTFADLDRRAAEDVQRMLTTIAPGERRRLVEAMAAVESLLGPRPEPRVSYLLRPHQPGDIGWVVSRHGALYAEEYGWNEEFEALVARIGAEFLAAFDPRRERCWIAERQGEPVGSVLLVKRSPTVAQLRLLLVEPHARGLGLGARLVEECERFARHAGYRKIRLWTQSNLVAAGRIYQRAGFRLVKETPHHSFGVDLVGQDWEKDLAPR